MSIPTLLGYIDAMHKATERYRRFGYINNDDDRLVTSYRRGPCLRQDAGPPGDISARREQNGIGADGAN